MSEVRTSVKLEGTIFVALTEGEARALDAIVGYGPGEFVKWFKKNLGKYYLEDHERHVKSLFETLRLGLSRELGKIDTARSVLNGTHEAVDKRWLAKPKKENQPQQP